MEEKTETTADNQEVPKEFACPVCGKWGRRHDLLSRFNSSGRPLEYSNHVFGAMYCNPRARRGGSGCGEVFVRARKRNGCDLIKDLALGAENGQYRTQFMVDLGHRMVGMLKEMGLHDGFIRKIKAHQIYAPYRKTMAVKFNEGGLCGCGCNRPTKTNTGVTGPSYATAECKDSIWQVARMIANQDESLKIFLVGLRGDRCEQCGIEPHQSMDYKSNYYRGGYGLEVDHIIEVVNGGGLCWIDNFQLLCQKCHKAKTARLATERANQRKQEQVAQTGQMSIF